MSPPRQPFGFWLNDPPVALLPGSNTIELTEPLQFFDRRGTLHSVPWHFGSDGASIPQWAWSLVGSPLDRRYRRAAVLHDWYCVTRRIPARDAHRLFYEGLRASGVHPLRASAFWLAVTVHRRRWAVAPATAAPVA